MISDVKSESKLVNWDDIQDTMAKLGVPRYLDRPIQNYICRKFPVTCERSLKFCMVLSPRLWKQRFLTREHISYLLSLKLSFEN